MHELVIIETCHIDARFKHINNIDNKLDATITITITHDVVGHRPATSWVHYTTSCNTQSSAPEDGQNNCPKHVELTGIINKSLLLHLVGGLYYFNIIIFFLDLLNSLNLFLYRMSCIS